MKKIILIMLTVSLNLVLTSCSESDDFLIDEIQKEQETQACCGEEEPILPPPPPPTGGN